MQRRRHSRKPLLFLFSSLCLLAGGRGLSDFLPGLGMGTERILPPSCLHRLADAGKQRPQAQGRSLERSRARAAVGLAQGGQINAEI